MLSGDLSAAASVDRPAADDLAEGRLASILADICSAGVGPSRGDMAHSMA